MRSLVLILPALSLAVAVPVNSQESQRWTSGRVDGHAPIGVMGDHMHEAGEFMLSYRYMTMSMSGLRSGSSAVTPNEVLENYMVTPLDMPMHMHMVGVMFAPSDAVTLMGMLPFTSSEMEHQTRSGAHFTTEAEGVGDISLSALVRLFDRNRQRVHFHAGASLPTGSIDERDVTPMSQGQEQRLPYPMQIGSGTVDLLPGLTYLGQSDWWSWGAQGRGTVRLGDNDNGYRLGNAAALTTWAARRWNDWWSNSVRLTGMAWGDVSGRDASLNPAMVPTADPDLRGGRRVEVFAGVNFEVPGGAFAGQRLALEAGIPLYRSLDGPQLERDWELVVGWQYAFAP